MYYHVSPILLAPNSVILPGNWGRIVKMYTRQNMGEVIFREKVLESVRQAHYPSKPSRLNAIFVLDSLSEARHFRDSTNKFSVIYEAEIVEAMKPQHRGDYYNVSPPANSKYFDEIENTAHAYWKGEQVIHPEILTESPLRVLKQID